MAEATAQKVQLRRREKKSSFLPNEVKASAQKVIGSVFKDRRPLGIPDEDLENHLLKEYADIREDDRDFADKKREFWREMRVIVPHDGKVLDVSTDEDGEPVNLEDYIIYEWAKNHPLVGNDRQEMLDDANKEFYIHNPDEEIKAEHKKNQKKKQAYKQLIKMEDDLSTKKQLLRILDDHNPDKMTEEMIDNKLDQIVSTQPKRFLKFAEDKNLTIRAEIEEMVEYGVLRKSGNQYIYMDEVIGDTIDDAVVYFNNDRNSQQVLDLRAKLDEAKNIG